MKYLVRPESLDLGVAGKFSFVDFVVYLINNEKTFNDTGIGIRAAIKIETAVSKEGNLIELPEDQWQMLSTTSEAPSNGYPKLIATGPDGEKKEILLGRILLPFLDAIKNATDSPPDN